MPPVELVAAYAVPSPLEGHETVDVRQVAAMPLLLLDSGFVVRKTFDIACRHAEVTSNVVFESAVAHNLLAFAEAGLGVAIVPSVVQTHRYGLRRSRITQDRKPLTEPLAIFWDKRRKLPRYISDFCDALSGHMRGLSSPTPAATGKSGRSLRRRASQRA